MTTNLVAGNNTYSSALGAVSRKSGNGMAGSPAGVSLKSTHWPGWEACGERASWGVWDSTSNFIQVGRIQFLAAVEVRATSPCWLSAGVALTVTSHMAACLPRQQQKTPHVPLIFQISFFRKSPVPFKGLLESDPPQDNLRILSQLCHNISSSKEWLPPHTSKFWRYTGHGNRGLGSWATLRFCQPSVH